MGVEVIADKMPACDHGVSRNYRLHMRQQVSFGACRSSMRSKHLSCHDITTEDEGERAMPDILELTPLHLTWRHRQAWMFALQGLYAGQLVCTHRAFPLLLSLRRRSIHLADVRHLLIKVWVLAWGQPVANSVGLQVPLFSTLRACRADICSTIPRRLISSASSRPVHWLMGRVDPSGVSQAKATILLTCSAVIVGGAPGRGTSSSRSCALSSSSGTACSANHRPRHKRTVSVCTPSARAIWRFGSPAAPANTIRARKAICCSVLWRRTSCSNSLRSGSLNSIRGACGPGIFPPSSSLLCPLRPTVQDANPSPFLAQQPTPICRAFSAHVY